MRPSDEGKVAVRAQTTGSRRGRLMLHLARPPYGELTVCGRYRADRYLPEDEAVPDDTPTCQVCTTAREEA